MVSVTDQDLPHTSWSKRWQPLWQKALERPSPRTNAQAALTRAGLIVWAPVWFAMGIGLWFWFSFEPGTISFTLAFSAMLAGAGAYLFATKLGGRGQIVWKHSDRVAMAALATMLFASGFIAVGTRARLVAAPVLGFHYYGAIEGRVIGIDRSSGDRLRISLDEVVLQRTASERTPERVRVSLLTPNLPPQMGARVMLTGHLGPPPPPTEPGGFDFRRNAWFERLGAVGYTRNPVMIVAPARPAGPLVMSRWRMRLSALIQGQIGGQSGAVAAALISGDRSGISEETNEVMRIANLYHIVSISGLHMSLLAGMVYSALRVLGVVCVALGARTDQPFHRWAAFGALLASLVYLGLSGGGAATERAFLMIAVMLIAVMVGRRAISLRSVALAALILLAIAPEVLTSPGFQMSFAATVALVVSYRWWTTFAVYVPKLVAPLAMLLFTSLVAGLATGPFAAMHFGRIAPYGMLANLLAVPIVGLIVMPMGVLAVILAPIGLAAIPLWLMGIGTSFMLWVAKWIASFGGADLHLSSPPAAVLPLVGTGMTILILSCQSTGKRQPGGKYFLPTLGLGLVAVGFLAWATSERPKILISAEGNAVGIMTPSGRVMSHSQGGAYYARSWLESDGDQVDPRNSAARPLWNGSASMRHAEVVQQGEKIKIYHLSGREDHNIEKICLDATLVISRRDLSQIETALRKECNIFDRRNLRKNGGLSVSMHSGIVLISSLSQVEGYRFWTER